MAGGRRSERARNECNPPGAHQKTGDFLTGSAQFGAVVQNVVYALDLSRSRGHVERRRAHKHLNLLDDAKLTLRDFRYNVAPSGAQGKPQHAQN